MFLPVADIEDFYNRAGVAPNCSASQAQQSLLAKLKSAYQESALGFLPQLTCCGSSEDFILLSRKQNFSHVLFMNPPQKKATL